MVAVKNSSQYVQHSQWLANSLLQIQWCWLITFIISCDGPSIPTLKLIYDIIVVLSTIKAKERWTVFFLSYESFATIREVMKFLVSDQKYWNQCHVDSIFHHKFKVNLISEGCHEADVWKILWACQIFTYQNIISIEEQIIQKKESKISD